MTIPKERLFVTLVMLVFAGLSFGLTVWGVRDQARVMGNGEVVEAVVERVRTTGARTRYNNFQVDVRYTYDGVEYVDEATMPQFWMRLGIVEGVTTRVTVDRDNPAEVWFAASTFEWLTFGIGWLFSGVIGVLFLVFAIIMGSGKGKV